MVIFDANRLRELRKKNRLKQEDVARMLGCSTSMISRWELGSTPITADKLARLIEIYHDENIADFFIQTHKGEDYEQGRIHW